MMGLGNLSWGGEVKTRGTNMGASQLISSRGKFSEPSPASVKNFPGFCYRAKWDLGGGTIEFGENAEDTVRREIREEYGAEVLTCEFLGYMDAHREQDGNPTHWISLGFKVLVDPTQIRNAEPHMCDEVRWFTFDDLPQDVHSQLPRFLAQYKERLG